MQATHPPRANALDTTGRPRPLLTLVSALAVLGAVTVMAGFPSHRPAPLAPHRQAGVVADALPGRGFERERLARQRILTDQVTKAPEPLTAPSPNPAAQPPSSAPASESHRRDPAVTATSLSTTAPPSAGSIPTPIATRTSALAAPSPTRAPAPVPVVVSSASEPQPFGPVPGTWRLQFSDDFETLEASRWTTGWFGTGITRGVDPDGPDCFDSDNATVASGLLHLELQRRDIFCNGATRPYAGSLVSSMGKYEFTYGYVEARAWIPSDQKGAMANWPALWTNGYDWPAGGEIDYMEILGGRLGLTTHYPGSTSWSAVDGGAGTTAWLEGDWSGWHTFGAEWRPGAVDFYVDGVKRATRDAPFSGPHYLLMNNTSNPKGEFVADATMQVDYIRVWQRP